MKAKELKSRGEGISWVKFERKRFSREKGDRLIMFLSEKVLLEKAANLSVYSEHV